MIPQINTVQFVGKVKSVTHQPTTASFKARTLVIVAIGSHTNVRVVMHDNHAAKIRKGDFVKIFGQLHGYSGGLEIRATNVLAGDAALAVPAAENVTRGLENPAQAPLTPDFISDHSAGGLLGGKSKDVGQAIAVGAEAQPIE